MPTLLYKDSTLTTGTISTRTAACVAYTTERALPRVATLSLQDYLCPATRPQFLNDMRTSLTELGTFYIKDHGVSPTLIQSTMAAVRDYFSLPLAEKKKMLIGNSRHFRGYKLMGEEFTNNQVDHREQLQFGPEDEALASFQPGTSADHTGLQGPNQWPASTLDLLPQFRPCILEYMDQLEILSTHLMEAIALSLDLDASYFRDLFGLNPYYRLKCAKYPSVAQGKSATIGCGAHKDTGFLTVLLQDMVGGLQGQDPASGTWMDTRPVPDTFIVTLGESVERLTDGAYQATVHRVLNSTSGQDRYSIPFFFDPALDAQIPNRLATAVSGKNEVLMMDSKNSSLEDLVEGLNIHDELAPYPKKETQTWSNGAHIFETVHRCHPEVYSRWYSREA
ncbi:hypothetical protein BGZ74_004239 [Mortierella antarctica]|nr:hypothetical protein BGZ74_004239 [Mortierella antarctica]